MNPPLPWPALLLALLPACAATSNTLDSGALHPRWQQLDAHAFELWLERAFAKPDTVDLWETDWDALEEGLRGPGASAVRAAVILSRLSSRRADELLLERLEARVLGSERGSDAGDVVAATALGAGPLARDASTVERLAALALAPNPHPDLEVRVQCAATALALGEKKVVPFLLRVLLIDTPAGLRQPAPWAEVERSAWARATAAAALSRHAGVENLYRTDASSSDRELETARLRALLQP